MQTIGFVAIGVIWTAISIWLVGIKRNEKQILLSMVKTKLNK